MRYTAACVQSSIVEATTENPGAIRENLDRAVGIVEGLKSETEDLALVVFPECFLTGYDVNRSASEWVELGLQLPGPETETLGALARSLNLHIAGAAYEYDPSWPGRYWNTAFIVGPSGEMLLKYRKHSPDILFGGTGATNPSEVYSDYQKRSGSQPMFPVARTEIGNLACLIGEDVVYPEVARALMLKGAEILLHSNFERYDDRHESRSHSRFARPWENLAYLLSVTPGEYVSSDAAGRPVKAAQPADGTAIYGWEGQALATAPSIGETVVTAKLDLEELRTRRADAHINFPAQTRTQLYAVEYEMGAGAKLDIGTETPKARTATVERARAVIEEMESKGIWTAPGAKPIAPYDVIMVQADITNVPDVARRDEVIRGNMERSIKLASRPARSPSVKLVVFPEYWLQGAMFGKSVDDFWPIVGIQVPGPETERLGEFAREFNVYVSGAVFEYDPIWPRRWFNCAFIISPQGELIHKYRKIQCADMNGMLNNTTPGNVYTEYIERYGEDGLFPVVDTEIGKLATCICFDNNFPELWRSLAMRGAEVICYPTGEPHNIRRPGWEHVKRAHAYENQFYIASANAGSEHREVGGTQSFFHRGYSRLVGFDGNIKVQADTAGEVPLVGTIDIEALRKSRHDPRENLMAHLPMSLYASVYRGGGGVRLDYFADHPIEDAKEGLDMTREAVERYMDQGVFVRPSVTVSVKS